MLPIGENTAIIPANVSIAPELLNRNLEKLKQHIPNHK